MHEVERNNKLIEDFTDNTFTKPKFYPSVKIMKKYKTIYLYNLMYV